MRDNKDFSAFATHYDWYTKDENGFYLPTENAPSEAIEAMKRANSRITWERKQNAYY